MGNFKTNSFMFLDYTEMDEEMSRMVWQTRNLPEIRERMVNPDPISLDAHFSFVRGLKDRTDVKYYAVLHEGQFVGSVNLHNEDVGIAERGIYIHPEHWGKGYAKSICTELYQHAHSKFGISTILTKVLKTNHGSNSLERSLGAALIAEDDRFFYYQRRISSDN